MTEAKLEKKKNNISIYIHTPHFISVQLLALAFPLDGPMATLWLLHTATVCKGHNCIIVVIYRYAVIASVLLHCTPCGDAACTVYVYESSVSAAQGFCSHNWELPLTTPVFIYKPFSSLREQMEVKCTLTLMRYWKVIYTVKFSILSSFWHFLQWNWVKTKSQVKDSLCKLDNNNFGWIAPALSCMGLTTHHRVNNII